MIPEEPLKLMIMIFGCSTKYNDRATFVNPELHSHAALVRPRLLIEELLSVRDSHGR